MQTAYARGTDDEDRGLVIRARCYRPHVRAERLVGEHLIDRLNRVLGIPVEVTNEDAQTRNGGDDQRRSPAAVAEFLHQ